MSLLNFDILNNPDTPASDAWDAMLLAAVEHRASDVHLCAQGDGLHIAMRIDGQLVRQGVITSDEIHRRLINHVKVSAELDVGEQRRPQDGRTTEIVADKPVDLRMSVLPTNHGQDLVVRILDRQVALLSLEELVPRRRERNRLFELIGAPNGLVLVTGPTGAGKTTTLYAILQHLSDGARKIVTIENPIEYDLPGINQSQINNRLGIDYAAMLRTVLRQDANIIMIGEVRDRETANAAVRAAVTGHLVFATMHSVSAASAIESIIALGAHPHFVARSLRGVIAQNLVRRICPDCAERLDETASVLPLDDVKRWIGSDDKPALSMGRGCEKCHHTGYFGRMALFEVLEAGDAIRSMIEEGQPGEEIHREAERASMASLHQIGKVAAFLGHTTIEEVLRVVPD